MQDTVLRVLLMVAGLMVYPREDHRVPERDDDVTTGLQGRGHWPVKEWLDQEVTPVNQEVTRINEEVPKEDRDDLKPVKEPQADQKVAQTDHGSSHGGLEETQVQRTHSEEDEEEERDGEAMMTRVRRDEDDSDRNLTTPEHQGEPRIDHAPSLLERGETRVRTQPDRDANVYPADEQQLLEGETPLVDQLSEDIQEGGSLSDHRIKPEREELVETDPKEPNEDRGVHPPDTLTEPPPEDKQEAVETEQEVLHENKEAHPPEVYPEPSTEDQGGQEEQVADAENNYIWYLWNAYSAISMIRFSVKYLRRKSSQKKNQSTDLPEEGETDILSESELAAGISLPDSDTLDRFYDNRVRVSPDESRRVGEFVEGFAEDLLEAVRALSDRAAVGVAMIEDFAVARGALNSLVFDVMVPLTPLDPYRFRYQLWCDQAADTLSDTEGWGRIKMEEGAHQKQNGCPCGNSDMDNILCLLHSENDIVNVKVSDSPLWSQTGPYLSKAQVTKWFQSEIRRAWRQISHKYEFQLTFRNTDAPGALTVRFRSGKVIAFNIKPVVKFEDTDAYLTISPLATSKEKSTDTFWNLSLTIYEDRFLKHLAKSLPENACHLKCLETAAFLNKMQTRLTGRSGLTDYHFKTALLHLLLAREHVEWHPQHLTDRLRDLFGFLEKSLQDRKLHHAFFGNPLVLNDRSLSGKFGEVKAVNIFRPLVVQTSLYTKTLKHFQEMLKNSCVLIQEYVRK